MYTITEDFINGLPKIAYRHGVGKFEGVVNHSTDSPNTTGGDTPLAEFQYESRTFENAFVHFFVGVENGKPVIRNVAPIEYLAWGCGAVGNQRFVQIELDTYGDPTTFKMAYDAYVWLTAKVLFDANLPVVAASVDHTKGTLWSHDDITKFLGNTTHTDPIEYLQVHGISWTDHIRNVQEQYRIFEQDSTKHTSPTPTTAPPSSTTTTLKDIEGLFQKDAIEWAVANKVMLEHEGMFNPHFNVTRADLAYYLHNLYKLLKG